VEEAAKKMFIDKLLDRKGEYLKRIDAK